MPGFPNVTPPMTAAMLPIDFCHPKLRLRTPSPRLLPMFSTKLSLRACSTSLGPVDRSSLTRILGQGGLGPILPRRPGNLAFHDAWLAAVDRLPRRGAFSSPHLTSALRRLTANDRTADIPVARLASSPLASSKVAWAKTGQGRYPRTLREERLGFRNPRCLPSIGTTSSPPPPAASCEDLRQRP
jgi:hypothetical protein